MEKLVGADDTNDIQKKTEEKHKFFPIFIKAKNVLLVGGGEIATRRAKTLNSFDFNIKIVAKEMTKTLEDFCINENINFEKRTFLQEDLKDIDMIVCCIDDEKTAEHIGDLARKNAILFNTSHKKEQCDFYFPAVVIKENAVIASSAQGKDHKFAKKLKQILERITFDEN